MATTDRWSLTGFAVGSRASERLRESGLGRLRLSGAVWRQAAAVVAPAATAISFASLIHRVNLVCARPSTHHSELRAARGDGGALGSDRLHPARRKAELPRAKGGAPARDAPVWCPVGRRRRAPARTTPCAGASQRATTCRHSAPGLCHAGKPLLKRSDCFDVGCVLCIPGVQVTSGFVCFISQHL